MKSLTHRTGTGTALVLLGLAALLAPVAAQEPDSREPAQPNRQHFLAHRYFMTRGIGWGWVKKPNQSWKQAKWVALKEQPEKGLVAPFRKLRNRSSDHEHEYKLYGYYADYKAYDPKFNDLLPVFVIEGYEPLGRAASLGMSPGSRGQVRERGSRASSRPNKPILGQSSD